MFKKKDAKLQLIRWVLLLLEFDIEIHDKKGQNQITDHVSRLEQTYEVDGGEIQV